MYICQINIIIPRADYSGVATHSSPGNHSSGNLNQFEVLLAVVMTPESPGIHGNHERLAMTLPSSSLLLIVAGLIHFTASAGSGILSSPGKEIMHPKKGTDNCTVNIPL